MLGDIGARAIYYGTLDDVVERYPWDRPLDLRSLRQQLVTSAIYGRQVLINDGYLVANPRLRPDLRNINRSLTGVLIGSGGARLFARTEGADLVAGVERSADRGVATMRALVRDRATWPVLRDQLAHLSIRVRGQTLAWPRDKNMGQIFHLLLERVAGLDGARRDLIIPPGRGRDFDAIHRRYAAALDKTTCDAARTVWEEAAWTGLTGYDPDPGRLGTDGVPTERLGSLEGYGRVRPMMNIANEIYHLAYAIGAAHALRGGAPHDAREVGVATALVSVFDDIITPEPALPVAGDPAGLRRLNQLLVSVPASLDFGDDFTFVGDIAADTAVREARTAYLAALGRFARGEIGDAAASAARSAYVGELVRVMAPALPMRRGLDMVRTALDFPLSQAADVVFSPFVGWLVTKGLDLLGNRFIGRILAWRTGAALGEDAVQATQSAVAVPLARSLGLYLGPMNSVGVEKLLERVGPHPAMVTPGGR